MKLATTYLGFKLRTPLVPSASPLSENLDNIKRMEDALEDLVHPPFPEVDGILESHNAQSMAAWALGEIGGVASTDVLMKAYADAPPFVRAATLSALYPNHAAYVAAVKDVTEKNWKAGYILRPEVDATIAAAEHSIIGQR